MTKKKNKSDPPPLFSPSSFFFILLFLFLPNLFPLSAATPPVKKLNDPPSNNSDHTMNK